MKLYIVTIEQVITEDGYAEYGKIEKCNTEESALTKFYQYLSNVASSLGKGHTYMDIKIFNSLGGCIKKDTIGQYKTEPEPESESES